MKIHLKFIWNILSWVLVVLFAAAALLLAGFRFAGLEAFAVLSGSMEPAFSAGSLLYVRETDPAALAEGDVITFLLEDSTVATHRVTAVLEENGSRFFLTKGDANPAPDANPVHPENVIGTPVFEIPFLGHLSILLSSLPGRVLVILGGIALFLSAFLPDLRRLTVKLTAPKESFVVDGIEIPGDIDDLDLSAAPVPDEEFLDDPDYIEHPDEIPEETDETEESAESEENPAETESADA